MYEFNEECDYLDNNDEENIGVDENLSEDLLPLESCSRSFFNIFGDDEASKLENNNKSFADELEEYLNSNTRPFILTNFWKKNNHKWPAIYSVFKKVFSYWSGNGEVERYFSILKMLTDWKRNRSGIDLIEMRLVLRDFYRKIDK